MIRHRCRLFIASVAILACGLPADAQEREPETRAEALRRERVERLVKWARALGGAKLATNPIQVWLRDLMMPIFLKFAANPTSLDWIYAYKVEWDEQAIEAELVPA